MSVYISKDPKRSREDPNIKSPVDISAPIRIRSNILSHHFIHLSVLYHTARQRNARNRGYIRSDTICPNNTILEAPCVPKNGEPPTVCADV